MSSDAKRAANSRYLAQFKTITLRMTEDERESIKDAAERAGMAMSAFIMRAIDNEIARQNNPSESI